MKIILYTSNKVCAIYYDNRTIVKNNSSHGLQWKPILTQIEIAVCLSPNTVSDFEIFFYGVPNAQAVA